MAPISGSERDRCCSPGVGAEGTLAWSPGYGGAELQSLWPWESQVTEDRGSVAHGVMPKVHPQLTPSSLHLPASKDRENSWGDRGGDWEREQVRNVRADILRGSKSVDTKRQTVLELGVLRRKRRLRTICYPYCVH